MKTLKNLIFSMIVVYVFVCGYMYAEQRNIMYVPDKQRPNPAEYQASDAKIIEVTTQDGLKLQGWYFKAQTPQAPVIIIFHGNSGHLANRYHKVKHYTKEGYSVLLAEYRGYGGNPGKPTEQGLYSDARAYLTWLENQEGINKKQIVLYGESLGTGVAVQMATEGEYKAVILEAPYSSTADVAKIVYFYLPVEVLMKDQFRSIDKIKNVDEPLLILHGTRDTVIPIHLSKRLYRAANNPKKFVEISGAGHNNLYKHNAHKNVLEFIDKNN